MNSKIDKYKEFIDAAVSIKKNVVSQWVIDGFYPDVPPNKERKDILTSLSSEQRKEISLMLQEAKESGIHDLLALLSDTSEITYGGIKLPIEPFGSELYYDFVARREGDEWPE